MKSRFLICFVLFSRGFHRSVRRPEEECITEWPGFAPARTFAGYISRSASTSTTTLRRGISALSACASIPRSAALSALRELAFRMM